MDRRGFCLRLVLRPAILPLVINGGFVDAKKLLEVMDIYRSYLQRNSYPRKKLPGSSPAPSRGELLSHCHAMLDKMEDFAVARETEKIQRWLGFMQGVLCSLGIYTLEDLMNHNRPPETPAP